MKKNFYLLLFCLTLFACEKENLLTIDTAAPQTTVTTLKDIQKMGFLIDHAQSSAEGYLVEGDLFFYKGKSYTSNSESKLKHFVFKNSRVVLKKDTPLKIYVSNAIPRGDDSWYNAIAKSLSDWNSIPATELRFVLTENSSNADIHIVSDEEDGSPKLADDLIANDPEGIFPPGYSGIKYCSADRPIGSLPGSRIYINTVNSTSYPNNTWELNYIEKVTQISHNLGHAVGFWHTDLFNYLAYYAWLGEKYPELNYNENYLEGSEYLAGDANDDHGTISMMDFMGVAVRTFSSNDIKAIQTLFPVIPKFITCENIISLNFNGDNFSDLLLYRPGQSIVNIEKANGEGTFSNIFSSKIGIAGFDFNIATDQAIALDYDGDGKDDIITYRPGQRIVFVDKSNGVGGYTNIVSSWDGMAGYDFATADDRAIALDYNGDGKDDILTYRPGQKIVYIAKSNGDGTFTNVFNSRIGIAGYDFADKNDQVIALDYNGDGKDDILTYRPGQKIVFLDKSNGDGNFANIISSWSGLAGYDYATAEDRAIALDYNGDGKDDIMTYRPGQSIMYLAKSNGDGNFTNVIASRNGIANYDLANKSDKVISLNYNNDGKDDILCYRPGTGKLSIMVSNGDGSFKSVFNQ